MLLALIAVASLTTHQPGTDTSASAFAPRSLAPRLDNLSVLHLQAPPAPDAIALPVLEFGSDPEAQGRPRAFRYSDGYGTRLKIHRYASYLTLPLFAAQVWSGSRLWNNHEGGGIARDIHGPVAASIAGLFAVNTVTGVWNLWEGRKDPNGRTRRIVHSLLMLTADAGFVATGASAPDDDEEGEGGSGATRHRNLAIGSMGVALSSYLMMLIWKD